MERISVGFFFIRHGESGKEKGERIGLWVGRHGRARVHRENLTEKGGGTVVPGGTG